LSVPGGKHNPERGGGAPTGRERGEVTLGARAGLAFSRPRIRHRGWGSGSLRCWTYEHFADRDPLGGGGDGSNCWPASSTRRFKADPRAGRRGALGRVSARRRSQQSAVRSSPVPARRSWDLMSRPLSDMRLAATDDRRESSFKGRCCVGRARGFATDGVKVPLGLWDGVDGELDRRQRALVQPARNGGLDLSQRMLCVIDGRQKPLRKSDQRGCSARVPVQRCVFSQRTQTCSGTYPNTSARDVQARLAVRVELTRSPTRAQRTKGARLRTSTVDNPRRRRLAQEKALEENR